MIKNEIEMRQYLIGLAKIDTNFFSQETLEYSKLEKYIYQNKNEIYEKYKSFMKLDGQDVIKVENLKIMQIVMKDKSTYEVNGDYFVGAEVDSIIESQFDKFQQTYNAGLYLDVLNDKEHSKYKIDITGVGTLI